MLSLVRKLLASVPSVPSCRLDWSSATTAHSCPFVSKLSATCPTSTFGDLLNDVQHHRPPAPIGSFQNRARRPTTTFGDVYDDVKWGSPTSRPDTRLFVRFQIEHDSLPTSSVARLPD
ncbi:hypothetical protein M407DRAFT_191872 [Tulasnella calospora MUT 4182]|uniref:Uncharacterized protein n=1 Tax=Tulasnella calospora MUT 4182 TaxID=1051891 RepID=A0A0C3K444_9AGAM|nr:hypothetical protein M407DRAFT_191872 [Tulasnella calospora MUT 4182]